MGWGRWGVIQGPRVINGAEQERGMPNLSRVSRPQTSVCVRGDNHLAVPDTTHGMGVRGWDLIYGNEQRASAHLGLSTCTHVACLLAPSVVAPARGQSLSQSLALAPR